MFFVPHDSDPSALQRDGPEEEHGHDHVGEERGEPDNLPGGVQPLPDDGVYDDPGQQEAAEELPLEAAHLVDAAGDLEHALAGKESNKQQIYYKRLLSGI